MILAHVAGVPVEELLPFALVSGAGFVARRARVGSRRSIHRVHGSPQLLLDDRHLTGDRGFLGAIGEEQREEVLAAVAVGDDAAIGAGR